MKHLIKKILNESKVEKIISKNIFSNLQKYNLKNSKSMISLIFGLSKYLNMKEHVILESMVNLMNGTWKVLPLHSFEQTKPFIDLKSIWAICRNEDLFNMYLGEGPLFIVTVNGYPLFALGEDGLGSITFLNINYSFRYGNISVEGNKIKLTDFKRQR